MTGGHVTARGGDVVPALVALLRGRGETLATAESLTGGAVAAALVDVPGVSAVFRGGIVAYATELKGLLLGVDEALLAREGAVHPEVARQMADGVRVRLATTLGCPSGFSRCGHSA